MVYRRMRISGAAGCSCGKSWNPSREVQNPVNSPDRQSSVPRRSFLSTLSSAAVVLPVAWSSGTMQTLADESQLDAMRRRRKKASQRRRRIIFNNDADDALMFRQEGTDVSSISSGASGIPWAAASSGARPVKYTSGSYPSRLRLATAEPAGR